MYRMHQARAWTANIIEGFEAMMEAAGIHSRLERQPAICFLDITGYTRLTQEHGDDAALAGTACDLARRLVAADQDRHETRRSQPAGDPAPPAARASDHPLTSRDSAGRVVFSGTMVLLPG